MNAQICFTKKFFKIYLYMFQKSVKIIKSILILFNSNSFLNSQTIFEHSLSLKIITLIWFEKIKNLTKINHKYLEK